jgi:hypothetical protein
MSKQPIKKKAFSFNLALYEDGSSEEKIQLSPGYEKFAAELLFSMSTGQMGQALLKSLMNDYPEEAKLVTAHLQKLYMLFMAEMSGSSEDDDSPAIRPSEVLGRQ